MITLITTNQIRILKILLTLGGSDYRNITATLIEIILKLGGETYISGTGADSYQDIRKYSDEIETLRLLANNTKTSIDNVLDNFEFLP